MKAWILYPSTTPRAHNAFSWFVNAAERMGVELQVHFFEELSLEKMTSMERLFCKDGQYYDLDFVIMRGYDFDLSLFFEARGIPVFNSSLSMALSRNKMATQRVLEAASLPVPETAFGGRIVLPQAVLDAAPFGIRSVLGSSKDMSETTYVAMNYRDYDKMADIFGARCYIVKQVCGSKGENVYLVDSQSSLDEALGECAANLGMKPDDPSLVDEILFQKYISTSYGRDVRVWVVGDKVVGCVLRHNEHSFKSNFAQGGDASPFQLPEAAASLAVKASQALGLMCSGVDLLFGGMDSDGKPVFVVCEVNGNAGFRTAARVNGNIDVPGEFIHSIITSHSTEASF